MTHSDDLTANSDLSTGLRLVDANIALGNLVALVRDQIDTYVVRGNLPSGQGRD